MSIIKRENEEDAQYYKKLIDTFIANNKNEDIDKELNS